MAMPGGCLSTGRISFFKYPALERFINLLSLCSTMKGKKLGLVGRVIVAGASLANPADGSMLQIENRTNSPFSVATGVFTLEHKDYFSQGVNKIKEGEDNWDVTWENTPPNPTNIWLKPFSFPYGVELFKDTRPRESVTDVNNYFAIVINSGAPDPNVWPYISANIVVDDGAFNGKELTFQQQSLIGDANEIYPVIDIRKAMARNYGVIPLYDPNGENIDLSGLSNGEIYAEGKTRLTKKLVDIDNNGAVDFEDLGWITDYWLYEGFANPADISGPNGIPDKKVNFLDFAEFAPRYGQ